MEKETKEQNLSEESKDNHEKLGIKNIIMQILFYGFLFFICLYVIPNYVVQRNFVSGPSMENTLQDKDQLIIDKLSYQFTDPKRFDIIVFYPYGKEVNEEYYIKRVIGLPGETIQIIGSDIYINGEILEESFGKDPITNAGIAKEEITLGSDEFFVLGDNRGVSKDSRSEMVGLVKKDVIAGKLLLRIWPFSEFGTVK